MPAPKSDGLAPARISVPRPSAEQLPRPQVTRLFDEAVRRPVTIVTGGPGMGKTSAVSAWAREGVLPGPVAWVSLDRSLSTSGRLWSTIVAALRSALGSEALGALGPTSQVEEDFIGSLADRIDGLPVVLVLDDVHELSADMLEELDQLLRLPPDGLHAVLISRHVPVLSLHRHRLAGRLSEVRSSDLSFTGAEIGLLAAESGICLREDQVHHLLDVTDGWPAAVRLALLMMTTSSDPEATLASFSGDQPLVAGYLAEELERTLSKELLDDLTRTSITERICAPLAVALIGSRAAVQNLMAQLGSAPLIVELADTGWFRYHPLLVQKLRVRLQRDDPALWSELHRRASAWFETEGEWLLALDHAIQAGDPALAIQVALRSATVELFTGECGLVAGDLARIPSPGPGHEAELRILRALIALCRLDYDSAAFQVARAETLVCDLPEPRRSIARLNIQLVFASLARICGDAERLTRAAFEAGALLSGLEPVDAPGWSRHRGVPLELLATGQLWLGRPASAISILHEARTADPARQPGGEAVVASAAQEALALAIGGNVTEARRAADQVLASADAMGSQRSAGTASAWLALALTELLREDQDRLVGALAAGEEAASRGRDPFVVVTLALLRSYGFRRQGDAQRGKRELARAAALLARSPGLVYPARLWTAMAVDVELELNRSVEAAQRVLADHDRQETAWRSARADLDEGVLDRLGEGGEVDPLVITRAQLLLATHRPEQVRNAVAGAIKRPGPLSASAWVAVALAEDRLRRDSLATEAMGRALDLADADGVKVTFRSPSHPRLRDILERYREVVGNHALVDEILRPSVWGAGVAAGIVPSRLREPLTEREAAVLAYLPTMRSNAEIAEALGISVNTVKQHLKSVHRKLGVTTRREAVRAARELGLLPEPLGH